MRAAALSGTQRLTKRFARSVTGPSRSRSLVAMASTKTPAKIAFCTGNQKKKEEVVAILASGGKLPFEVEAVKIDLPELQVWRHSWLASHDLLGRGMWASLPVLPSRPANTAPPPTMRYRASQRISLSRSAGSRPSRWGGGGKGGAGG